MSRRNGIGYAIAERLLREGARVFVQGWSAHDADQPWGADPVGFAGVLASLPSGGLAGGAEIDFSRASGPSEAIAAAVGRLGHVDSIVINHARSSKQGLPELTAEELDLAWAVNTRAALLLVQGFAQQFDRSTGGRVVLFTSGQHVAPMREELPYAVSKGALHQITMSLADALADAAVTVNCVNPGPTDTGWADQATTSAVQHAMPRGRWNSPDDVAAVVTWLLTDDASIVTGQVINAEAGFRRTGPSSQ